MKYIIFISSFILVQAVQNDEVIYNGVRHYREVLYENVTHPSLLNVHYASNTLYFRFDNYGKYERNYVAKLNLHTREFREIEGVSSTTDLVINQATKDVFIGTYIGVYKYNPIADKTILAGFGGRSVQNLVINHGYLYFNPSNSDDFYLLIDGLATEVSRKFITSRPILRHFFMDDEGIAYFVANSLLYKQEEGAHSQAVILYSSGETNAVTADRNGKVYFGTDNGIYEIPKGVDSVKKLFSANISGLTFDKENNVIYSEGKNIYRLKPIVELIEIKEGISKADKKIDELRKQIDNMEIKLDEKLTNIQEKLSLRA